MKINIDILPFKLWPAYFSMNESMAQLDKRYSYGSLSSLEYRWRCFFWNWSTSRYSGKAGKLQDRCFDSFGMGGINRRIERVAKIRQKYMKHHFGDYAK